VCPLFLFHGGVIISKVDGKNFDYLVNDQIRAKEVRVVTNDGKQLGIMSISEAQAKADEYGMDLVLLTPKATPPVCKIIDYGKFIFEQNKKLKDAKKKQKVVSVKEIWLKLKIEEHDFNFKVKNASKFLQDGDKVKVTVKFRGREMNYMDSGKEVLMKFAEALKEYGEIDKNPKMEGKSIGIIINPKA
jgi:translation initiation factor IF-3